MAGRVWPGEERKAQAERATKQMSDPAMRERVSKNVSESVCKRYGENAGFGFLAMRGKPNAFLGKTHTEEAKQLNREAHLGGPGFPGPHSEESKKQMSLNLLGNQRALGHKMSEESKCRMITSLRERWRDPDFLTTVFESYNKKPNDLELDVQRVLDKHFPGEWKYVGAYQVWIGGKNPDFINVNGKGQVIEVFGIFWHDRSEAEPRTVHYRQYGFDCLILWEDDVWNGEDAVIEKIRAWEESICARGV